MRGRGPERHQQPIQAVVLLAWFCWHQDLDQDMTLISLVPLLHACNRAWPIEVLNLSGLQLAPV